MVDVAIACVWPKVHMSFYLGWIVPSVFALFGSAEARPKTKRRAAPAPGAAAPVKARTSLLLVQAGAIVVSFLNPYGADALRGPIEFLSLRHEPLYQGIGELHTKPGATDGYRRARAGRRTSVRLAQTDSTLRMGLRADLERTVASSPLHGAPRASWPRVLIEDHDWDQAEKAPLEAARRAGDAERARAPRGDRTWAGGERETLTANHSS